METQAKILLCDENGEERARLADSLSKAGFKYVDEVSDGERALEKIGDGRYDVVIVDLWISGIDGIGILRAAQGLGLKKCPALILMSPINKQSILMEAS